MKKIIIFLVRNNVTDSKIRKFGTIFYISMSVLILLFGINYTIHFTPKFIFSLHFTPFYWIFIALINIWSFSNIFYYKRKITFIKEYRKQLAKSKKIVCVCKDDKFEVNKVYAVHKLDQFGLDHNENILMIIDDCFIIDEKVFKFISFSENRKEKLEKLEKIQ